MLEAEAEVEEESLTAVDLRDTDQEAPVIKLVHALIAEAIELGASDIHFAPEGDGLQIYYRVDGVLAPASVVPKGMSRGVVSRIKIMAEPRHLRAPHPAGRPALADRRPVAPSTSAS